MKHLLAIAALLVSTVATAGSSSQAGSAETGGMVSWVPGMRAMHYGYDRNTFAADSSILVCPRSAAAEYNAGGYTCLDANKQNAWQKLENVTPTGMKILGIDYRLSGSSGYRSLIVYYVPQ